MVGHTGRPRAVVEGPRRSSRHRPRPSRTRASSPEVAVVLSFRLRSRFREATNGAFGHGVRTAEFFVVDVGGPGVGDGRCGPPLHGRCRRDGLRWSGFRRRRGAGHHAAAHPQVVALGDGAHVEEHLDDVVTAQAVTPVEESPEATLRCASRSGEPSSFHKGGPIRQRRWSSSSPWLGSASRLLEPSNGAWFQIGAAADGLGLVHAH